MRYHKKRRRSSETVSPEKYQQLMDQNVFNKLWEKLSCPEIDFFASSLNAELQRFASWRPQPGAAVVNTFSVSWADIYCYFSSIQFDCTTFEVNKTGGGRHLIYDSTTADKGLVCPNDWDVNRSPSDAAKIYPSAATYARSHSSSSSSQENETLCLQTIRQSYETGGISQKAVDIAASWIKGTKRKYGTYLQKWAKFCHQRSIDYYKPAISDVLDLYQTNIDFSAIITARCALPTIIMLDNITICSHYKCEEDCISKFVMFEFGWIYQQF